MAYDVRVNILNYDKWYFKCEKCGYHSENMELLSDLTSAMTEHSREYHAPKRKGYPAPVRPSQVLAKG